MISTKMTDRETFETSLERYKFDYLKKCQWDYPNPKKLGATLRFLRPWLSESRIGITSATAHAHFATFMHIYPTKWQWRSTCPVIVVFAQHFTTIYPTFTQAVIAQPVLPRIFKSVWCTMEQLVQCLTVLWEVFEMCRKQLSHLTTDTSIWRAYHIMEPERSWFSLPRRVSGVITLIYTLV